MKKRLMKNAVATLALAALLLQNVSSVAVMASELSNGFESDIIVENDYEEPADITVDNDFDVEAIPEYIEEEDIAADESEAPADEPVEEIPESVEIMSTQISGSGVDSISVIINTDGLNSKDTFRIVFTGADDAQYDPRINDVFDVSSAGTYTFENLKKEGFNIRATSDDDVNFEYSTDGGTPVIRALSALEKGEYRLTTGTVTLSDGKPVESIVGEGFENVIIDLDTADLADGASYIIYVDTDADVLINGESASELKADNTLDKIELEGLDGSKFTVYGVEEEGYDISMEPSVINEETGRALLVISGREIRVKREYKYEDSQVLVTATLEYPEAVPDDAEFVVTPITEGPAYEAYMEALNKKAEDDEEITEYTEENTLLYDVAFLVDKKDEDGNVIKDEKVEYEPEAGSVKINFVFKKSQLSDDMAAEEDDEIEIVHLTLSEDVKEDLDKTIDAEEISVKDITVDVIEAEKTDIVEGGKDSLVFSMDSFSTVGVRLKTSGGSALQPGSTETFETILGSAKNFGLVANYMNVVGHMETNFAVKEYAPSKNVNFDAPKNGGNGGAAYIGGYTTPVNGRFFMDANEEGSTTPLVLYTTRDVAENVLANNFVAKNSDGSYRSIRDGIEVDTETYNQGAINSKVDSLRNPVITKSADLFKVTTATAFNQLPRDGAGYPNINIADKASGTYYINFVDGEYTGQHFVINMRSDQTIVFNIPDAGTEANKISFGQYECTIDGTHYTTSGNSCDDIICQHVIFNCPNAEYAQTSNPTAGTFIVPKAKFYNESVAAGWLVADRIEKIGGAEWHCVYHDMPDAHQYPTTFKIGVRKVLENNDGSNPVNTFTLYKTDQTLRAFKNNQLVGEVKGTLTFNSYTNDTASGFFDEIELTEAGQYYFVVRENEGGKKDDWESTDGQYWGHIIVTVATRNVGGDTECYISNIEVSKKIDHANGDTLIDPIVLEGNTYTFEFRNRKANYEPGNYSFEATKHFGEEKDANDQDKNWPDGFTTTLRLVGMRKGDWELDGTGNWISNDKEGMLPPMPDGWVRGDITYPDGRTEQNAIYKDIRVSKSNPKASFGEINIPWEIPANSRTGQSSHVHRADERCRCYMYKVYEVLPDEAKASNNYTVSYNGYDVHYGTTVQTVKLWVNNITNHNGLYRVVVDANGSTNHVACEGSLASIDLYNDATITPSIDIPGKKEINPNTYPIGVGDYAFTISANNANAPMPVDANGKTVTEVKNYDTDGNFIFENIRFSSRDEGKTYVYTIKENSAHSKSVPGMSYSFEEYYVTVKVTKAGKEIKADIEKIEKKDGNTTKSASLPASFTNTLQAYGTQPFEAKKIYTPGLTEGQFSFKLEIGDENGENRQTLQAEAPNKLDGTVNFKINGKDYAEYSLADVNNTYYYYIEENLEATNPYNGIHYDTAKYRYVVNVKDGGPNAEVIDGKAKLNVTYEIERQNDDGTWSSYGKVPEFENTYSTSGGGELTVQKNTGTGVSSETLKNVTFHFDVYETDANHAAKEGGYSKHVTLTGSDKQTLNDITYTKADTYYYTIQETNIPALKSTDVDPTAKEVNGFRTVDGITYDTNPHYVVIVVEDKDENGKSNVGTLTVTSQTVDGEDGSTVEIKNTYEYLNKDEEIVGRKTISGEVPGQAGIYHFILTKADASSDAPMPDVTEVSNGADGNNARFKFGPITYTKKGTYEYNVNEKVESLDGIIYNETTYKVVIVIDDDGKGNLYTVSKKYYIGENEQDELIINNTKVEPDKATINAKKIFKGGIKKTGTFEYELLDSNMQRIGETITVNAGETKPFASIPYTLKDLAGQDSKPFTYYVHEVKPDVIPRGYIYDEAFHPVTVTVERIDTTDPITNITTSRLQATVSYDTEDERKENAVISTNEYNATGTAAIPGTKTLIGRKIEKDGEFQVRLKPLNSTIPNAPVDTNEEQIVPVIKTDDNNGTFEFTGLSYSQTGEYKYDISEVGADEHEGYDTRHYTVTVHVIDRTEDALYKNDPDEYGTLYTWYDIEGSATAISFENVEPAENSFTPKVYKTLKTAAHKNPMSLEGFEFRFTLTEEGKSGSVTKTADENGLVLFDTITYKSDKDNKNDLGPHTYYITEEVGSTDGVVYDTAQYKIEVNVEQTTTSTLKVDYQYYYKKNPADTTKDWQKVEEPKLSDVPFENEYSATGTDEFSAEKILVDSEGNEQDASGKKYIPGKDEFSFTLTAENGTEDKNNQTQYTDGVSTTVKFNLNYDEEDLTGETDEDGRYIKRYRLVEDKPTKPGLEYGNEEYLVTAYLKDNKNGKISVEHMITPVHSKPEVDGAVTNWFKKFLGWFGIDLYSQKVVFVNEYDAYGELNLSAFKTLNGGIPLNDGDYTFTLTGEGVSQTKPNVGNNVYFDKITYSLKDVREDPYVYEIKESEVTVPGVDKADADLTYTVTVYVRDKVDENGVHYGVLDVDASVSDGKDIKKADFTIVEDEDGKKTGVSTAEPVEFINNYTAKEIPVVISGSKDISNLPSNVKLSEYIDDYKFTMKSAEGNPKQYTSEQKFDEYGKFTFDEILFKYADLYNDETKTFDKEKDFYYTVEETGSASKVDNDPAYLKEVMIKVIDMYDGTLDYEVYVDGQKVSALAAIKYDNTFIDDDGIVIKVKKTSTGANKTAEFGFILEGSDNIDSTEDFTSHATVKVGDTEKFPVDLNYTLDQVNEAGGEYKATYTIKEDPASKKDGYEFNETEHTVDVTVTYDKTTKKLVIDKKVDGEAYTGDAITFEYDNSYTATGETFIIGTKKMSGGLTIKPGDFSFKLSGGKAGNNKEDQAAVIVQNGDASVNGDASKFRFDISGFDASDDGQTYTYYLRELTPEKDGITRIDHVEYDQNVYPVVIKVSDNGNGTLEVTPQGDQYNIITILNKFEDDAQASFTARKVTPNRATTEDIFQFQLEEIGRDKKLEDTVTVTNSGQVVDFDTTLEFTQEDIGKDFRYMISEVKGDYKTYTYSEAKFYAKVDVSIVDGQLVADNNYYRDEDCTDKILDPDSEVVFSNPFEDKTSIDIGGTKVLKGFENATSKGTYTFILSDKNGEIDTDTITGAGPFKFDTIPYTHQDLYYDGAWHETREYTYYVEELNGGRIVDHIKYDGKKYEINVTLGINKSTQKLEAVVTNDPYVKITALSFENVFATEGSLPLQGTKNITGKELAQSGYVFYLYKDGVKVAETTNAGPSFTFTPSAKDADVKYLIYDEKDIGKKYTYTVKEISSPDGSEIDTQIYTVVDEIKDYTGETVIDAEDNIIREKGDIMISRVVKDDKGVIVGDENDSGIVFNNTYHASGPLNLEGYKVLENKELKKGDYKFVLDVNGERYVGENEEAELNDGKAVAKFTIPTKTFTEEDLKEGNKYLNEKTFYYTITEEGTLEGVENATDGKSKYNVAVHVQHSGNNDHVLNVTPVVTSATGQELKNWFEKAWDALFGSDSEDIIFTKTYCATGQWDPEGTKELTGREFASNDFQFSITEIESYAVDADPIKDDGVVRTTAVPNEGRKVKFDASKVEWLKYNINDPDAIRHHYYRVEEIEPSTKNKGDIYDKTVFVYDVNVYDTGVGGKGSIKAEIAQVMICAPDKTDTVTGDAAKVFKFTFNNKYEAEGSVPIRLSKVMTGRDLGDDVYHFTIADEFGNTYTTTNVGNTITFEGIDMLKYVIDETHPRVRDDGYKIIGDHEYFITEDDIDSESVKKDFSEYRVTVNVSENMKDGAPAYDGELVARITRVDKKNSNGDWYQKTDWNADDSLFAFENEYHAEVSLNILAKKHVKRNPNTADIEDPEELAGFEFYLYEYDNAARTGKRTTVGRAVSDGKGDVRFDTIRYTERDLDDGKSVTKYYSIEESKPTSGGTWKDGKFTYNGVTYSNAVYEFDVTISPNGDSDELLLAVENNDLKPFSLTKVAGAKNTYELKSSYDFINIKPVYTKVTVVKKWNGGDVIPAERPSVRVELMASVKDYEPEGTGKVAVLTAPDYTYTFENLDTLDEDGNEISYSIAESPIPGYYLAGTVITVDEDGNTYVELNNIEGDIFVHKYEAGTASNLPGATLAIYTLDGKELERWVSGTFAHKVEAKLTPGAEYILRELTAPTGYNQAPDVRFTVRTDVSSVDPQIVEMYDPRIVGSVHLRKLDAATREALSGAEFALYKEDGTRVYASGAAGVYRYSETSSNGRFFVDARGELDITDLPYGTYYFEEITAPSGYELSTERLGFSVLGQGEVVEVSFLNEKLVGVAGLRKANADGTRSLAGAVFELYARTPRSASAAIASTIYSDVYYRVGTYVTDEYGRIEVRDLPWDDYYFIEVEAPAGYVINTDTNGDPIVYTFTIDGTSSRYLTYDLGTIINSPEDVLTPPPTPGVDSGRRLGGVLSDVLGVRAAPKSGVLGERVGPVTGDFFNIALWLLLLVACIGTIVAMFIKSGRRNKKAKLAR